MAKPLIILTLIFAVMSVGFLGLSGWALKKRRVFRTTANTLLALLMLSLTALAATLTVSTQGYRALIREEVVASVTTRKVADQQFEVGRQMSHGIEVSLMRRPGALTPPTA